MPVGSPSSSPPLLLINILSFEDVSKPDITKPKARNANFNHVKKKIPLIFNTAKMN